MKELYELKELLCDELKAYGKKGDLTAGSLDVVDKLSHALKSIETIIAMEEASDDYSSNYGSYERNGQMMNGTTYRDGGRSYARGRRGNVKRDSMGRYSRDDEMDGLVEDLRDLMEDAPNDHVRTEIQKLVKKFENM